jgi:Fic family protein
MSLQILLDNINSKIKELDSLRPIDPERMKVIYNKFKLDSNFYTNHFEGNTLTIGETKQLILFGLNASIAKKVRHVEEMRGHIEAFDELGFLTDRVLTEDKLPLELNQSLIKNLHKLIFVQDEIIHKSENGIDTITTLPAGNYKIHPNSVMTSSGTLFEYSDPTQVPSLMSDLLDWYNGNRSKLNPVVLASIFHYKFIRIHPFGDGNGRMARLSMNLILQSAGYSLIIVKSDQQSRDEYINALSLTDNNFLDTTQANNSTNIQDFEIFIEQIAKLELDSLDLMIRGGKGEDITEVGDLIKEMAFEARNKSKHSYSIDEILADPELKKKQFNQLKKVEKTIMDYYDKVLKEMFYRADIDIISDLLHEYDAAEQNPFVLRDLNIEENEVVYFNLNLNTLRENDKKIVLSPTIFIKYEIGRFHCVLADYGQGVFFNYLEINLEEKLKLLIQYINGYIDNQIKNYNKPISQNIMDIQMPF